MKNPDFDLAGGAAPAALAKRPKSPAFMEKALYWAPPVAEWVPLKKTKNSTLRIAALGEDRLTEALAFEGEVLLLTPQNWERVLRYARPQLLLVESMLASSTGHWHMAQHPASRSHGELVAIVALARKLSIPSVFWITKGHEYHAMYREYARHFDLVGCADPLEAERLAAEGIRAEVLLPCVQSALHNPFRSYEDRADIGLHVLYDGWADIDRLGDRVAMLENLKPFGLSVVESRYEMFRNRAAASSAYADCILGCVTPSARRSALKYATGYATLAETLSSTVTQQWMSIEAAASRVPVVHMGRLPEGDLRRDFAIECPTGEDFVVEFLRQKEDKLYRQRVAHIGWRAAVANHTYAHRLQLICKRLGILHDWEEYPRASLITPTFRRDMLPRCLETYEQIAYPNKELVLVFNGAETPTWADLGLSGARHDIVLAQVPAELFAGATLNIGHVHASGRYCFRMDDDDHYAPNYVLDMVLQASSVDAALFGKPAAPLVFEGEEAVYVRDDVTSLVIAPLKVLQAGKTWLGGNSIAGSREFFEAHSYSDVAYGAADTELVLNLPPDSDFVVAFMDPFNMAAARRSDLSSHTWKNPAQQMKAARSRLARFSELVV